MPAPEVAVESLGCKLNQAEAEAWRRALARAGFRLIPAETNPDVYVLNTCTVTHVADAKGRRRLRQVRRACPAAFIVAAGCYARRAPEELEADLFLGHPEGDALAKALGQRFPGARGPTAFPACLRSRLKIQEGCNARCAFCAVPGVRGRERSLPPEQVLAEAQARVAEGGRELVLTGTQPGRYGRDLCPPASLELLVGRLLAETRVARLRLPSLQPQDLSPGLLALLASERVCRHFQLSLQSGSDAVLRRMGRRYTSAEFWEAAQAVREAVPGAALTTDIMVGFPGESEPEFWESYEFARGLGFARLHVFPYSPRPGTAAFSWPRPEAALVERRRRAFLALAEEAARSFRRQFLGQTLPVLWEEKKGQTWSGLTDNYLRVLAPGLGEWGGKLMPARLVAEAGEGNVFARVAVSSSETKA